MEPKKHIYANLAPMGWTDLTSDPNCEVGIDHESPLIWWEENAKIYAPEKRDMFNSAYQLPYLELIYEGKEYRISPYLLQIVYD